MSSAFCLALGCKIPKATRQTWKIRHLRRIPAALCYLFDCPCASECAKEEEAGEGGDVGRMMRKNREDAKVGGVVGKPIIVQITGRLWIFHGASSTAFPFTHSIAAPLFLQQI